MLTKFIVIIILRYIHISDHYVVHLKLTQKSTVRLNLKVKAKYKEFLVVKIISCSLSPALHNSILLLKVSRHMKIIWHNMVRYVLRDDKRDH